jgi:hypothetical protein
VLSGDCPGVGAMLTLSLGGPEAPTSDSVAAFVAPTSGGFRRSLGVMKEKDIHSKHVKVRGDWESHPGVVTPQVLHICLCQATSPCLSPALMGSAGSSVVLILCFR